MSLPEDIINIIIDYAKCHTLLSWIDINKLDWDLLSDNYNAIQLLAIEENLLARAMWNQLCPSKFLRENEIPHHLSAEQENLKHKMALSVDRLSVRELSDQRFTDAASAFSFHVGESAATPSATS